MDMENNNEELEFDLDDILNEFHDMSDETDAVEPDAELEALLQMPELSFSPAEPAFPDFSEEPEVSRDNTLTFEPVSDAKLSQAVAEAAVSTVSPKRTPSCCLPRRRRTAPSPPPRNPPSKSRKSSSPLPLCSRPSPG